MEMPEIQKPEGDQNVSGNMYSYREDNNDNDYQKETNAIRRSIGEGNPNQDPKIRNSQTNYVPNYVPNYAPNYVPNYSYNNPQNPSPVPIQQSDIGYRNSMRTTIPLLNSSLYWVYPFVLLLIEIIIILLIGLTFRLDNRNTTKDITNKYNENSFDKEAYEEMSLSYGIFLDVNIFVFVGFGILHNVLKKHTWASIIINLICGILSFQIGFPLVRIWKYAFRAQDDYPYKGCVNFQSLTSAIFNSATVLVSLGAVIGKLAFPQYIIMTGIETILCSLNYKLNEELLAVVDSGGALYVHLFGTIFGVSLSLVLFCSTKEKNKLRENDYNNKSSYFSNTICFFGMLFLWCYFPSFNSANIQNEVGRYRSIINTYLALLGSTMGAFTTSPLINRSQFIFEEILFGSYSGGVMIAGCSCVCDYGWSACLIGFLSGIITTVSLSFFKPYLNEWGMQDSANIIHSHGIPGFLGGFITPMIIGNFERRKDTWYTPYKDSNNNENHYWAYKSLLYNNRKDIEDRAPGTQAGIQIGAVVITVGISFIGGIATGYLMKVARSCGAASRYFHDSEFFDVIDDNVLDAPINGYNNGPAFPLQQSYIIKNKMDMSGFDNQGIRTADMKVANQPSYNN